MADKPYFGRGKDILDVITQTLDEYGKDIMHLKNIKQPTMPTYPTFTTPNPGDLPDDPIQGQVAISSDDDTLWFYSNGAWHQAGADLKWIAADGTFDSTTFPPTNTGPTSQFTLDHIVSSSDGIALGGQSSLNGVFNLDDEGALLLPVGMWIIAAWLLISTTTGVSGTAIGGLFFNGETPNNQGFVIGGVHRSEPTLSAGGFRNWEVSEINLQKINDPDVSIEFYNTSDLGIGPNGNMQQASLDVFALQLTPNLLQVVI